MPPLATQYLRDTDLAPTETDRKQLSDTAGSSQITTTKANFSTSTTRRYLHLIPLTTTTATVTPGNIGKGWKIDPDTMGATASVNRVIPAGTWTFNANMVATTAQLAADTKLQAVVSRVNGTSGTGTILFTATSAATQLLVTAVDINWTSASQADFILGSADTIIVEFFVESIGVAVVGQTLTFNINAAEASAGDAKVIFPGAVVLLYFTSASSAGVGVTTRQTNYVRLGSKAVVGVGVVVAPVKYVRLASKSAVGIGVTPAPLKYVKPGIFAGVGIGVVTAPVKYVRLAAKASTAVGITTRQGNWVRLASKSATGIGVPVATRTVDAFRSFTAVGTGVSSMTRAVIAVRTFLATAVGVPDGEVKIKLAILNRLTGGGTTIVKKIIALFDD